MRLYYNKPSDWETYELYQENQWNVSSHRRESMVTSPFISYASKTSVTGLVAWDNGIDALYGPPFSSYTFEDTQIKWNPTT